MTDIPFTSLNHGIVADSKFEPCCPNIDLVERGRLLKLLDAAIEQKLAVVVAPAGFGKSVLMGQWVRRHSTSDFCCAWLTLDPTENDVHQFLAYLVLAIAKTGVVLDDLENSARSGFSDASPEVVLVRVVAALRQQRKKVVLILEDYHRAECSTVNGVVTHLLRECDNRVAFFIDSRERPDLDIPQRVAAGEAIEISAEQLRLTQEETVEALSGVVNEPEAGSIYSQTEGWPVAVQLAAAQLRTHPSEPALEGFSDGLIASYLTAQILSSMEPEARELLLSLAFLERFNYELVDYVTQSNNSRTLIEQLSPLRALLISSEGGGEWMRLHHLFAEYLRELRNREDAQAVTETQLRASDWYREKGSLVEAVKYAAMAEDYEACTRLILDAGGLRVILTDGIGVLRNALRHLPDNALYKSFRLMLARAYLHCKHGEIMEARALLDAALAEHEFLTEQQDDGNFIENCDRLLAESMINIYGDQFGNNAEYSLLLEKYLSEDRLEPLDRGTVLCEMVVSHLAKGEFDNATGKLRDAFTSMRQSGSVLGLNYCYVHAAQIALCRGELEMATANVKHALQMAEENFGSDSGLKNLAQVLHCAVRIWQGVAGTEDLEILRKALSHTMEYDGWVEIYIVGSDALVLLAEQTQHTSVATTFIRELLVFAKRNNLYRLAFFAELQLELLHQDVSVSHGPAPDDPHYFRHRLAELRSQLLDPLNAAHAKKLLDNTDLGSSLLLEVQLRIDLAVILGSKSEMANAIKLARDQKAMGAFLANNQAHRLLRELREDYRQDEQELLSLQFIHEVLANAERLQPSTSLLSSREQEVLEKLLQGLSNKEIARGLQLTENTVKFHLKKVFTKLQVKRRTQAVAKARELGLIESSEENA